MPYFLLFYAKENSDPEVVCLALWRVGLRVTLNGKVCTVDTSVAFLVFALGIWTLRYEPLVSCSPVRCLGVLFLAQRLVQQWIHITRQLLVLSEGFLREGELES